MREERKDEGLGLHAIGAIARAKQGGQDVRRRGGTRPRRLRIVVYDRTGHWRTHLVYAGCKWKVPQSCAVAGLRRLVGRVRNAAKCKRELPIEGERVSVSDLQSFGAGDRNTARRDGVALM